MTEAAGDQKEKNRVMVELDDALAKGPVDVFHLTPIEHGGPGHIERGLILEELKRAGVVTAQPITGKLGAGIRYELKPKTKKPAEKDGK